LGRTCAQKFTPQLILTSMRKREGDKDRQMLADKTIKME